MILVFSAPAFSQEKAEPQAKRETKAKSYHLKRFIGGDLQKLDFRDADFSEALLQTETIETVDWENANLRGAQFDLVKASSLSFKAAKLMGAKLTRSRFADSDFREANFKGAYIADTKFVHSILPSDLKQLAILINVHFENCTFK